MIARHFPPSINETKRKETILISTLSKDSCHLDKIIKHTAKAMTRRIKNFKNLSELIARVNGTVLLLMLLLIDESER